MKTGSTLLKKYAALIIGCILIIFPLLTPGYIMSFDMPWGPNFPPPDTMLNYSPLFTLIDFAAPHLGWVLQKSILAAIILLSAFGAFRLIETLSPKLNVYIYNFAALLYVYNPFFYSRFITGQWLVLAGYALLPWAVRSMYIFCKDPKPTSALLVVLWLCAISFTSIHTIAIASVAAIAILIYSGVRSWKPKLLYTAGIVIVWLVLNSVWLVPFAQNESSASRDIASFSRNEDEMHAFATNGTVLDSPALSALLLTGFWADDTNRYMLPSQLPFWWLGVLIIGLLVMTGIIWSIRTRNKLGYTFIFLGVLSWLLGIGTAWNITAPITETLLHRFPLYGGYREPQKWLMLLALSYVFLSAVGAQWLYSFIAKRPSIWVRYGFVTTLLVTPFLLSPTLIWGAAGQLRSAEYPAEWNQAKSYLQTHASHQSQVLVLPWHMYLPVSFTGRVVANPAGYYFDQKMITGNNFELPGVMNKNNTPLTDYIDTTLARPAGTPPSTIGDTLASFDISYILLLKESDWQNYTWLGQQPGIVPVVENNKLILYTVHGGSDE